MIEPVKDETDCMIQFILTKINLLLGDDDVDPDDADDECKLNGIQCCLQL